jgi:hypothetical protein
MEPLSGHKDEAAPATTGDTEEYAVMPRALRAAIASLKGRAPVAEDGVVKVPMAEAFPISAAALVTERIKETARQNAEAKARAEVEAEAAAEAEAIRNPQIGQLIKSKGIFMGPWEPKDRNGTSLGKKFNVFASFHDLTNASGKSAILKFKEAAEQVAGLRNWNGHDGGDFENDTALHNALKDGSAVGKWFIPPLELLYGKDANEKLVRPGNNLYELRDTGDFKGTFFAAKDMGLADWYWSCTESRSNSSDAWIACFSDGGSVLDLKRSFSLRCRPCRVELAP